MGTDEPGGFGQAAAGSSAAGGSDPMQVDASPSLALADLDSASLTEVFDKVGDARELAMLSATCQSFRAMLADNTTHRVWAKRLEMDFGIDDDRRTAYWDGPPPTCLPRNSPRAAWHAWNNAFKIKGPNATQRRNAVRRVCCAVINLKEALGKLGMHGALSSFTGGLSPPTLTKLEDKFKIKLPLALRTLWTCTAGQDLIFEPEREPTPSLFWGAFGGYSFYRTMRSMRLIHVQSVVEMTTLLHSRKMSPTNMILLGANFDYQKRLLLDCDNGTVHIWPARSEPHHHLASPVPTHDCGLEPMDAPLVLWLENYVQMLESHVIGVESISKEFEEVCSISSKGLCLYPRGVPPPCSGLPYRGPVGSESITKGVRIRARPLFVPEMSDPINTGPGGELMFAYCITMELLDGYGLRECQLTRRHWVIRDAEGKVLDTVDGEGVVGEFPRLRPDEEPFTYQSCTTTGMDGGSMEGHFEFIAGRVVEAEGHTGQNGGGSPMPTRTGLHEGSVFQVEVPSFLLCRPLFVY